MKRLNRMRVFPVRLAVCVGVVAGPTSLVAREAESEGFLPVVVAGNNGFAIGLYGQLAKETPEGNLFFSPYSVDGALLMAAEGAQAETLAQMADVLHFPEHLRTSASHRLFISQVLHKAFIETSEKGTEAAAATVVLFPPASRTELPKMVPFTPTFRADKPFIFLIREQRSGAILFLGRITNPNP